MKYLVVLAALFAFSTSFSSAFAGDTKPAPKKATTVTTDEDHGTDHDGTTDEEDTGTEEGSDDYE